MTTRTRTETACRSAWASRLGLLICILAFAGLPVLLYRLEGGYPSLPRLTSWAAVQASLHSSDSTLLTNAILRNGERLVWALWGYLLLTVLGEAAGTFLERTGRPAFRAFWKQIQPRSALAAANLVMALAIGAAPRLGGGPSVTAVPVAASSLFLAGPGRASRPGGAQVADLVALRRDGPQQPAVRQHVVRAGETLWEIARQDCGTPLYWRQIADLNGIEDPGRISPGRQLEMPTPCQASYVTYVVEPGDSLARIAQREYGTAMAATAIWEANRDALMNDGRRFTNPDLIHPDWTLWLPAGAGSSASIAAVPADPSPAAPVESPDPSPPRVRPTAPDPVGPQETGETPGVPAFAVGPTGGTAGATSPTAAVRPAPGPGLVRQAPPLPGRKEGIRMPGGVLPYGLASGLAAVLYLARLRRRSRRRLADPEPRRPDGPIGGALRGVTPIMDALTPHTLALLEVWQVAGAGFLPRVLGAWEADQGVAFLLDVDPAELPADGTNPAGSIAVSFGVRDGASVAVTRALKEPGTCLRREVVPFVDEILVPVGCREGEGWLHLPLLNEPIAVVGERGPQVVWSMLMAAAVRAGAVDLHISVLPGVLSDLRLPQGLDLPQLETIPPEELLDFPGALRQEAERRRRAIVAEGFDSFAELQAQWPSLLSAWVLVMDVQNAEPCASELADLATLGVGALVLGDCKAAPRRVSVENGLVAVSASKVGTFEGLAPVGLAPAVVEELEAETYPATQAVDEPGEAPVAATAASARPARRPQPEARLRLYVLGGFRAVFDGQEVPMSATSSALARELVARLAVAYPAPVTARELRADLWPDDLDPDVNKVQPLYQLVSRARVWLRGAGDDDPIIEPVPGRTRQEGASYRLHDAWVDLVAFRQAADAEDAGAPDDVLALYAGDLLAGQDSDAHFRWVETGGYRDEERIRFFGLVARIGERMLADGEPGAALSALERALSTRDGMAFEELACLAMRCEAARGSPDGIRRRYSRLCSALEQDEASAATMGLMKDLLASSDRRTPRLRQPNVSVAGLRVISGRDSASRT